MFVCGDLEDVDEEDGTEVVVAPFEEGVVFSEMSLEEVVVDVSTATGMLDEPAEIVDVAVATAPSATVSHAKRTAETPFGPSK